MLVLLISFYIAFFFLSYALGAWLIIRAGALHFDKGLAALLTFVKAFGIIAIHLIAIFLLSWLSLMLVSKIAPLAGINEREFQDAVGPFMLFHAYTILPYSIFAFVTLVFFGKHRKASNERKGL